MSRNRNEGCAGRKSVFDWYATTKSGGSLMLSGGLLADNLTELLDLYKAGAEIEPYYHPLIVILFICLLLNITGIILSLILGTMTYPNQQQPYGISPNVIVPSDSNPALATSDTGMAMTVVTDKETPTSTPPKKMKLMNDILTVTTGLVFILISTKNAIRGGMYTRHCSTCNKTR